MSRKDMALVRARFADASTRTDEHEFSALLTEYGTEVVSYVGAEVRGGGKIATGFLWAREALTRGCWCAGGPH